MRFKNLFLICALLTATVGFGAVSGIWNRFFQDIKLPSQAVLETMSWAGPIAADTDYVVSAEAANNSAATTFTSFDNQPDFARNITITPGGSTGSVVAGTAVVTGTNIFGQTISENFAISNAQSTATTGNKAFKSVVSVLFPATDNSGVTVDVGVGSKLGVHRCANVAGALAFSVFDGAYESTRGTFAVSASAVESNTFIANGTLNGAKVLTAYFIQNFRCSP